MPAAYATPPATVSKALDAIADDVLAMATGSPRPTNRHLATSIQPGVTNPLDPHLELVNELRDPARNDGGVYTWVQILAAIKGIDPSLADCKDTTLRSWFSRRTRRVVTAQASAARATAGRDDLAAHRGVDVVSPRASEEPPHTAAAPEPSNLTADTLPVELAATPSSSAAGDARAEAAAELAKMRRDGPNEFESVLSRFVPQSAQQ
jgi:hypothetical protein